MTKSNVTNCLRELLAARRVLICAAFAVGCVPVLLAALVATPAHALLVLALPLLPLVLLILIAVGVLDAAVRDSIRKHEAHIEFPEPFLCRG